MRSPNANNVQHRWQFRRSTGILMLLIAFMVADAAQAKSTMGKLPKKFMADRHDPAVAKLSRSVLDRFPGDLSADDVGFLKALDRQFVKYGNVKIKVENVTGSAPAENHGSAKKRTINNELGYGYNGQQQHDQSSYSFSQPKFQIYPYSQHDIPARPDVYGHQQSHYQQQQPQHHSEYNERVVPHSIEIQPSLSYELKQTPYGYQSVSDHSAHQPQIAYAHPNAGDNGQVPVIVLRIPGPHKYAAHLQQLLQQYLELRAAEYIHAVQQQEHVQQQQYQQPQFHYEQQQQYYEPQYQAQQQHQQSAESDYADGDSYYAHPTAAAAIAPVYGVPSASAAPLSADHLPIQENYPSPKHTRVIYPVHDARNAAVQHSSGEDYYDDGSAVASHSGVQQPRYLYEYRQEHPQQQQHYQAQADYDADEQVDSGEHSQQQHYDEYEQPEQQQHEQHSAEDAGANEHQQQYAHAGQVSLADESVHPTAAASDDEHTHSPYERPYNYHAHANGVPSTGGHKQSRY